MLPGHTHSPLRIEALSKTGCVTKTQSATFYLPRITPQEELSCLVDLISAHPDGIGIDALLQSIGGSLQRRSLQRRLATLIKQGRVQMFGESRAVRYRRAPCVITASIQEDASASDQVSAEVYVPTSPEGEEIKAYVRQARQLRPPVGYKLAFLEQYHPNQTAYLPQGLRDQLHALGRSPAEQTPAGTFARDILNRLLIDLSWASSQLEGNTYSRLDTERLIEFGQAAEGKGALETQMILNHKQAIEYLVGGASICQWPCRSDLKSYSASSSRWLQKFTTRSSRLFS